MTSRLDQVMGWGQQRKRREGGSRYPRKTNRNKPGKRASRERTKRAWWEWQVHVRMTLEKEKRSPLLERFTVGCVMINK